MFCLTPRGGRRVENTKGTAALTPSRTPGPGEQYRFHFDMTKCIGCHCCEVACNEQNNNPAGIRWRRVGEIEGGAYPFAQRLYLSMGCNHCLEPSCLQGCPVDAYSKDALTGIVRHSADACIGCQYCTWNCQYGVPQFNEERGVVGKCDMCYGRLGEGREPACVNACPEQAIQIEIVNISEWKREYQDGANAPGMPAADKTVSTTRITLPPDTPSDLRRADYYRVRPEDPHTPLVLMLVLTQLSVGAFAALWLAQLFGIVWGQWLGLTAGAALALAGSALAGATLHLGRPIHAWRALRMWKRSWLSREVLLFGLFSGSAALYAAAVWLLPGVASGPGMLSIATGIAGIWASARIYRVPARPAWDAGYTTAEFFLTAATLGPLFVAALTGGARGLILASVTGASLQLLNQFARFLWLARSEEFELRASARLVANDLAKLFVLRIGLLMTGGVLLPLAGYAPAALACCVAAELVGRYLFFVSVAPRNVAATFFPQREAA